MPAIFFSAASRGVANYDWLRTKYSYSFADYYNPDRMGFGALRVINDDWIAPGAGFPTHGHQNMEIITIPLSGSLAHKDNAGGEGVVNAGAVQVMSAGTGVLHSEFNASKTDPVELFQIWIEPNALNVAPRYTEAQYSVEENKTGGLLLVGPEEKCDTWIHQDAYISRLTVLSGEEFSYSLHNPENGVHLFVIKGEGMASGHNLKKRDALEIIEETEIVIQAFINMDILCIEVPL